MKTVSEHKKLGFGSLRLPLKSEKQSDIDYEQVKQMVDIYMENGFEYFEAAWNYHEFACENAIKVCLTERYPRESYILTDKMPVQMIKSKAEYEEIFQKQLVNCGVEYFDYYLLHNINNAKWKMVEELEGFQFLFDLKKRGLVGKIGFSFHGDAPLLEEILKKYGDRIDVVQLQINYLDWDSEAIQSRKCYELARSYNLPIFVMEPVKGGNLVSSLPPKVKKLFDKQNRGSYANWAIRWVASLEGVSVVLSGMSTIEQVKDNVSCLKDFEPMTEKEKQLISQAVELIKKSYPIQCTQCRYCVSECPKNIPIPELFSLYNSLKMITTFRGHYTHYIYNNIVDGRGKPDECIKCGKCEKVCSQNIEIRKNLEKVDREINHPRVSIIKRIYYKICRMIAVLKKD